eukprot:4572532-Pleurochrysis_carterae.AAC.2
MSNSQPAGYPPVYSDFDGFPIYNTADEIVRWRKRRRAAGERASESASRGQARGRQVDKARGREGSSKRGSNKAGERASERARWSERALD